jgi:chemotaxis protein CheD
MTHKHRHQRTHPAPHMRERRKGNAVDYYAGEKRSICPQTGLINVKLFSGDCYITDNRDEMLVTILGSCVAACIRDTSLNIGGMNHFLLPGGDEPGDVLNDGSTRYGAFAMEQLINGILKMGGKRERLEVKVFGGGNVITNNTMIGTRNASFVRSFLRKEGLSAQVEDLEGTYPRRIHYYPASGKVMMRLLKRTDDRRILEEETQFARTLNTKPIEGNIELF